MDFEERKKNFIEICKAVALDDNPSVYEANNRILVRTIRRGVLTDDFLSYNPSNKSSVISTVRQYNPSMDPDDEVVKVDLSKENEDRTTTPTRTTVLYSDGMIEVIDNDGQERNELTRKQMHCRLNSIQEHLDRNSKLFEKQK